MYNQYSSSFIFSLADKYQLQFDGSNFKDFSDEKYFAFCEDYILQSKARDFYLKIHFNEKPNLFRTFLPWREYIFDTVLQVQWYYDELVIYDPIIIDINIFRTNNNHDDKIRLIELLALLHRFKENIENEFLLFGSYESFVCNNDITKSNNFDTLISLPEVREECDKLVQVYRMQNRGENNDNYFNVRCCYRNKEILFPVIKDFEKMKNEHGYGVWFHLIDSDYTLLTIDDTRKEGFYNRAFDSFTEEYAFEIRDVLQYIDIGSNIKMPILFDRKLDKHILSNIQPAITSGESKTNDYYRLILPFVDNIPPERLFDLRQSIPNAFLDFRNLIFEIIYDYEKSGVEPEFLKLKIEQKINPLLRKLDAEMKNSVTKIKIIGGGVPLATGIGALGLWHYGIDISKFSGLLLGGVSVATTLTNISNYITDQRTSKANSVYYLWEAKRSK